jgi:uncharacterized protein (TIGR03083 family)
MTDRLDALQGSVARLRAIVEPLTDDQLSLPAYPTEWSIADVVSHLGSGAEINTLRLDAALADRDLPDDVAPRVWDVWNAKSPRAKVTDGGRADRALVDRLVSLSPEQRNALHLSLGPLQLDFDRFVGLRLNEHALHTWDVEVALTPSATIPPDVTGFVLDNLGLIAQFAGKPPASTRDVHIRTTEPARDFTLSMGPEGVSLEPCAESHPPDLELPAEALIRLVYGRLDSEHAPPVAGNVELDELRRVFPGL